MQFGIFTVGDVTPDPTTGRAPTEHERIKAMVAIAKKAEDVGLDVFATGDTTTRPSSRRRRRRRSGHRRADRADQLSTATTLITTTTRSSSPRTTPSCSTSPTAAST